MKLCCNTWSIARINYLNMINSPLPDFIIIDDDPLNNIICKKVVSITFPSAIAHSFTNPDDGLQFILSHYSEGGRLLVLFLDINTPVVSGWESLKRINDFPQALCERISIYMLSSSIFPEDREKAVLYPFMRGFINKPLSRAKISSIFDNNN
jgi:CheY-like chemotaxis protein